MGLLFWKPRERRKSACKKAEYAQLIKYPLTSYHRSPCAGEIPSKRGITIPMEEMPLTMETKAYSEHHLKLRVRTVLLMTIPASGTLVGVLGFTMAICMAIVRELSWGGTVYVCPLSLLMMFGFGWVVLRFVRRVLAVKTIRELARQQLEITTRTNRKFTAKLPENIRYALSERGLLTVAVGIDGHVFVIDSAEYSNSEQLNQFLQQFVNAGK
jgi:hypothetical protein